MPLWTLANAKFMTHVRYFVTYLTCVRADHIFLPKPPPPPLFAICGDCKRSECERKLTIKSAKKIVLTLKVNFSDKWVKFMLDLKANS